MKYEPNCKHKPGISSCPGLQPPTILNKHDKWNNVLIMIKFVNIFEVDLLVLV